jgi:hypothetical protein
MKDVKNKSLRSGCDYPGRQSLYTHGINKARYLYLYLECGGVCAVCGKKPKKLNVDHNHESGEIRGLLCKECNLAIGLIKDNPKTARKMARYIRGGAR